VDYIKLPGLDDSCSVFDIAQAHAQLEADYNDGGWLQERPSNRRRMEATACQLQRLGFSPGARWVDILAEPDEGEDSGDDDVRDIYLLNVLQWRLPIDAEMMACIKKRYAADFIAKYPQCAAEDYKQG
jgi:hypothetical protein